MTCHWCIQIYDQPRIWFNACDRLLVLHLRQKIQTCKPNWKTKEKTKLVEAKTEPIDLGEMELYVHGQPLRSSLNQILSEHCIQLLHSVGFQVSIVCLPLGCLFTSHLMFGLQNNQEVKCLWLSDCQPDEDLIGDFSHFVLRI